MIDEPIKKAIGWAMFILVFGALFGACGIVTIDMMARQVGEAQAAVTEPIANASEVVGDIVTLDLGETVKVHHEAVVDAMTRETEFVGSRVEVSATQEYRRDGVFRQTQRYYAVGYAEASITFDGATIQHDSESIVINLPRPKLHAAVLETEQSGGVDDKPGNVCKATRVLGGCDKADEQTIRVDGERQIRDEACQLEDLYRETAESAVDMVERLAYSPDVPVTVLVDGQPVEAQTDWLAGVCS